MTGIMVGHPSPSRQYLDIYLYRLATLCKDAKTSFSMLVETINVLSQRPPQPPPSPMSTETRSKFFKDIEKWKKNKTSKPYSSLNRIALHSFILTCANISKLVWPPINPNPKKQKEIDKMKRRQKRKTDLEKFFPIKDYPNLEMKEFRNFLEHTDDEFDSWQEVSKNRNIAIDTTGFSGHISGDVTIWNDFDPSTFTIKYYHEKNGSESANLKEMYDEILKLLNQIPKALVEIHDAPINHYDFLVDSLE